jgi:hypothetical protein
MGAGELAAVGRRNDRRVCPAWHDAKSGMISFAASTDQPS